MASKLQSFNLQRVDNGYTVFVQYDGDSSEDRHLVFHDPENVLDVLACAILEDVEEDTEDDECEEEECCGICQLDDPIVAFLNALIRG